MRAWIAVVWLAVACSGASRAFEPVPTAGPPRVDGILVDASGRLVTDAVVTLTRIGTNVTTHTDARGSFSFTDVAPGRYYLGGHDGDDDLDGGVIHVPGTQHPYTLRTYRGLTLALHVVDAAGAPVAGARIGGHRDAVTDAGGVAELHGLGWHHSFRATVAADGFVSRIVGARAIEDPGGRIDWTVTLERGAVVRGLGFASVVIAHEEFGAWTWYQDLGDVTVERGQRVQRGDIIGHSGGAHRLHLELCTNPLCEGEGPLGGTTDPLGDSGGCFDPTKSYPTDHLVLTYPVRC